MKFKFITLVLIISAPLISGCYQGRTSKDEPIHLNPNMDNQEKVRPQSESGFFADGSSMRIPPEGTVARGQLRDDTEYYTGKKDNGDFIKFLPGNIALNMDLLLRGQERYNIFCSPCHGRIGDGKGIISSKGIVPPPTFHQKRIRDLAYGQIFDVITNGIRNMPTYKFQVPVEDRWAIAAYFKALQRSQNASLEDVPQDMRGSFTQ